MNMVECLLAQYKKVTDEHKAALKDLTPEELLWRPGPHCESIAIIYFHQARWEDQFLHARMHGTKDIWETQGWYKKFNMPIGEPGIPPIQTGEDIANFKAPAIEVMVAYEAAARAELLKFLEGKTDADFDKIISYTLFGRTNQNTLGHYFATMVMHLGRHAGEMLYLRGLQKGMNK